MGVARVKKINIIAHADHKDEILDLLYNRGYIQVFRNEEGLGVAADNLSDLEYKKAKVKYALDCLHAHYRDPRSLLEKINQIKPDYSLGDVEKLMGDFDFMAVSSEVEAASQRINSLKNLITKLNEEKESLADWHKLSLSSGDYETATTKVFLGILDKKTFVETIKNIYNTVKESEIVQIDESKSSVFVYMIVRRDREKEFVSAVNELGVKLADLGRMETTPARRIKEIEARVYETEKEITSLYDSLREKAGKYTGKLRAIYDWLEWKLDEARVEEKMAKTRETFAIAGWISASDLPRLTGELKNITKHFEIVDMPIASDEEPPIIMENAKGVRPFEFVTNIYGYPRYREIDPTPYLAGFFIVFFGLCLTDAGYGIVLSVASFLALKYLRLGEGFRKLLKVLFIGGFVTMAAGALTGGWFGIVLEDLIGTRWEWFAKHMIGLRRINPVESPLVMLVFSIILGYFHLLFGNFIDLWWKAKKEGDLKEGLRSGGVWIYFLLSIGFWILSMTVWTGLAAVGKYIVISALVLVVLTQGRGDSWLVRIFGGLAQLYFGLSGYLSDLLSYSRLLALGLATGIIGMVINIVGAMVYEKIPVVGFFVMVLVLIGGHLMNLVISLVGAFVHSGRLQYVEFFKVFFEGGGKEFRPFVKKEGYVNLEK